MSKGFHVFKCIFKGLLGVSFLFMFFGFSHAAVVETTGEDNCNRVDTIDLGDGWSVKHLSLHADRHVNIGRTEVYYNNERIEFHDTVFYANSRWTWWYSAPACATHSKISSASFDNGVLDLSFDSFNPQSGPGFGTYATTTRTRLDSNPLQLNIGKQEIDAIVINPYAIGSGFNHVMKLNLFSSGAHVGGASIRTEAFVGGTDARSGTRLSSAYYYGHSGCSLGDVNQNDDEYIINFTCGLTFTKTSSAINGSGYTRTNNYEGSFSLSKNRYNLCSYDEQLCEDSLPTPTNLTQFIQSPELSKDEIYIGEKIGKFQSGSGIILNVDMENSDNIPLKLAIKYSVNGGTDQIEYSDTFTSGSGELILPYSGAGDYIWSAAISNEDETELSDWVEFKDNYGEADFILYEGFEPYPYGYKFFNNSPSPSLLTGGIGTERNRVEGRKWDIFYNAFPNENFGSEKEELAAFESTTLNQSNPSIFNGGNCFGMALSSASIYDKSNVFESRYPDFTENIGNDSLWNSISLSYDGTPENPGNWNEYNTTLETILSNQLFQYDGEYQKYKTKSETEQSPLEISQKIKNNPGEAFVLSFRGKINCLIGSLFCDSVGHTVVPYKVEGNKIYISDNNYQYPYRKIGDIDIKAYERFIEISADGKEFSAFGYNWKNYDSLSLVSVDEAYDYGPGIPIGLDDDMLLTLEGTADFIITDNEGNETGYIDGEIIEEIPGSQVFSPLNISLQNEIQENNWKQIYLQETRNDISIEVKGNEDESYSLMVLGGNYYNKVSSVEIGEGEVDIFQSGNGLFTIDFDDSKQGEYNILMDDFTDSKVGTVLLNNVYSTSYNQKYTINWQEAGNIITYELDSNNDGSFDMQSIFENENEFGSISGYMFGNTNATMAGWKIYLDINNDGELQENTEPFTTTDKEGYYEFIDLTIGNYILSIEPHKNWNMINNAYELYLNKGQNFQNINFNAEKTNGKNKK